MALSGGFAAIRLTVPLRHVRGFPAPGLLRGLCPSLETSPGLVACRRYRDAGARVEVLVFRRGNPWCGRWTTLPLTTRTARPIGTWRRRAHVERTQSAGETNRALVACSSMRTSLDSVQRVQSSSSTARALARASFHRGTCGNPPRGQLHPCGQFRPLGSCRPPIQPRRRSRPPSAPGPTRARMTPSDHRSSSPAFTTHFPFSVKRGTIHGLSPSEPVGWRQLGPPCADMPLTTFPTAVDGGGRCPTLGRKNAGWPPAAR